MNQSSMKLPEVNGTGGASASKWTPAGFPLGSHDGQLLCGETTPVIEWLKTQILAIARHHWPVMSMLHLAL